jgi:threonine/homoserine/homoserine lactone efflux protein
MPNPHGFLLFIIASLVLLLTPGPSVLYITTRTIDQGRLAGFASVFGTELGGLILAISTAAGLSAILTSSILVFNFIKYLGAVYLFYLGIKRLLSKTDNTTAFVQRKPLSRVFIQGTCVAVLNPKSALFFLAFLPQFTDISRGNIWQQTLLLGLTFVGLATCTDSMYVLLANTAGNWLRRKGIWQWGQRYLTGGIYLTLGMLCACSGLKKD